MPFGQAIAVVDVDVDVDVVVVVVVFDDVRNALDPSHDHVTTTSSTTVGPDRAARL